MRFLKALPLIIVVAAGVALADRVITASSSQASITHGTWRYLSDGGFKFEVCGYTVNTNDGGRVFLDRDCIDCEPGAWSVAPTTCVAQWKVANGL